MSAHLESRLRDILRDQRPATSVPRERCADINPVCRTPLGDTLRHAAATLDGDVIDAASGPCVVIERFYPADHWHGTVRIGDVRGLSLSNAPELRLVAGSRPTRRRRAPSCSSIWRRPDWRAAPAPMRSWSAAPFSSRMASVSRQYFLGAFQHERTLLNEVDGLVRRSAGLVSYNGKSFDVPMLETRYHFNRLEPPFGGFAHVDMLHVARRFWRSAPAAPGAWPDTDSCRLSALERVLFGVRRVGDVQGVEIPNRYFDYVRSGNAERLEPVFEHNRLDLLSLALITARALHVLEDAPARCASARESLRPAGSWKPSGRLGDAERCYVDAIDRSRLERGADTGSVRADAMRSLALRYRREARFTEAADVWRAIVVEREASPRLRREALEALAIHLRTPRARPVGGTPLRAPVAGRARRHAQHGGEPVPARAPGSEDGETARTSSARAVVAGCGGLLNGDLRRGLLRFGRFRRRLLPLLDGLRAVLLREPLDAAFRVDQLLAAREERVAVRADFQVQLGLGRARLPRRAARAARLDVEVFRDGYRASRRTPWRSGQNTSIAKGLGGAEAPPPHRCRSLWRRGFSPVLDTGCTSAFTHAVLQAQL